MKGLQIIAAALALAACAGPGGRQAIQEDSVTYWDGTTVMKGYIVYDDSIKAKRPGVVVVHEWWGITEHTLGEARNLARQGYTAFVADMFGDGKTADNPKDAGALAGSVRKNPAAMHSRFSAARETLAGHATVDASRIGAIGFCFGGSVVLDMARQGVDLRGVTAFHAGLPPSGAPAAPGKVKAKVLVLNGAADPFIKPDTVEAFKKEMEAARVDYRYINYPGAVHAFTNPAATENGRKFKLPLAYHAQADQQSKSEMRKFLGDVLR